MDAIPDPVRRFLLTSIPSVPHLETLMLLWREPERAFKADDIASRLYVSASVAAALADDLSHAELLAVEEDGASYRARQHPVELRELLDQVDRTYARQVKAVSQLLHSNLNRKAHSFAEAFFWRKA